MKEREEMDREEKARRAKRGRGEMDRERSGRREGVQSKERDRQAERTVVRKANREENGSNSQKHLLL